MVWFLIVSVFRSQYGTTLNLICLVTCWFHRCHKYVRLTMPQLPASGLFNIVVMLTVYRTSQCLSLKPRRGFGANLLVYDFTSSRVQNIDMRPSFAFRFFLPFGPRELTRDPREYWCICFRRGGFSSNCRIRRRSSKNSNVSSQCYSCHTWLVRYFFLSLFSVPSVIHKVTPS